jgi:trehalose-6-phosphatase
VLRRIARAKGATTVLFVGDDVTDEAAFHTAVAPCFVTIRVGRDSRSGASYYLSSQSEIDDLLRTLLMLSRGPSAAQRPTRRR